VYAGALVTVLPLFVYKNSKSKLYIPQQSENLLLAVIVAAQFWRTIFFVVRELSVCDGKEHEVQKLIPINC